MKNIKYGKNKHNRMRSWTILKLVHVHENTKCNYSRKYNCDEVSKWRHLVGSSSSYPCQSRNDIVTGLCIMSRN